jgi:hypothetical protein
MNGLAEVRAERYLPTGKEKLPLEGGQKNASNLMLAFFIK